jgi:hypothetical protein
MLFRGARLCVLLQQVDMQMDGSVLMKKPTLRRLRLSTDWEVRVTGSKGFVELVHTCSLNPYARCHPGDIQQFTAISTLPAWSENLITMLMQSGNVQLC